MTKESLESPLSFEFICLEFGDKCITNFKLHSKTPFKCGEIVCGNHSHATKTHRVVKTNTQHKCMNIIPLSLYGEYRSREDTFHNMVVRAAYLRS